MDDKNLDKLEQLLLHWEEAWELGRDISASELCADAPELLKTLEERIDRIRRLDWMMASSGSLSGSAEFSVSVENDLVGSRIDDRFIVESMLGEGGFGRVYRAFDSELQRRVAIKVNKSRPLQTEGQAGALLSEARRVASLRHPGIVSVHDVGNHEGQIYIVSELIEGMSLAEVVRTRLPSPIEAALLVADVADALHFAHENGFVHRDIKPANLLVDAQNRTFVADFGIATTLDELATGVPSNSGTLAYMAPEQLVGEVSRIGPRTDIYALGIVLYELLTGKYPYSARTTSALREQILFQMPLPPQELRDGIPGPLAAVCLRCLAKLSADRWATAQELSRQLRLIAFRESKPYLSRWWTVIVLSALGAISVGGLSTWLFWSPLLMHVTPKPISKIERLPGGMFVQPNIVTPFVPMLPMTIEAWVRAGTSSQVENIVGCGEGGHLFSLCLSRGYPIVRYENAEEQQITLSARTPISPLRWSHLAVEMTDKITNLYVDGKRVATGAAVGTLPNTPLSVGRSDAMPSFRSFTGMLDSLRISKGARFGNDFVPEREFLESTDDKSPSVQLLYVGGVPGSGNLVIPDLSGQGNNGRIPLDLPILNP